MAYERLEPDPNDWTMHLMANLLAMFANANFKMPQRAKAEDFLPKPFVSDRELESKQRWDDILDEMRAAYAARHAKVVN